MYPDISKKIRHLYVMGGNIHGVGNVTRCAEFNFWFDVEAASIVLSEAECPLYILPWEPCVKASQEMPHQGFRFGTMNSFGNDITALMDVIEKDLHYFNKFIPCDAFLVACYAFPQMIKKIKHRNVEIELNGTITRGQMVIDYELQEKKAKNAFVIEEFDVEFFKKIMLWVCGHEIEGF